MYISFSALDPNHCGHMLSKSCLKKIRIQWNSSQLWVIVIEKDITSTITHSTHFTILIEKNQTLVVLKLITQHCGTDAQREFHKTNVSEILLWSVKCGCVLFSPKANPDIADPLLSDIILFWNYINNNNINAEHVDITIWNKAYLKCRRQHCHTTCVCHHPQQHSE